MDIGRLADGDMYIWRKIQLSSGIYWSLVPGSPTDFQLCSSLFIQWCSIWMCTFSCIHHITSRFHIILDKPHTPCKLLLHYSYNNKEKVHICSIPNVFPKYFLLTFKSYLSLIHNIYSSIRSPLKILVISFATLQVMQTCFLNWLEMGNILWDIAQAIRWKDNHSTKGRENFCWVHVFHTGNYWLLEILLPLVPISAPLIF